MKSNSERVIFHIDVNNAYLSWEATYRLQQGEKIDLREIPSVVGGNEESRHGIVLAKSNICKKMGITTGETLYSARNKCANLTVVPPRYWLYMQCSNAMNELFQEYTPMISRFSVDESWLDLTNMSNHYKDPIELAHTIKDRIKNELGFTVSIGVSSNKLLAKMGSDLKKPNAVTSLFPNEIKEKMWSLDVSNLFGVGRATLPKLNKLNIFTIGDLANYDLKILQNHLKSHGTLIHNYANGIDHSEVRKSNHIDMKGIGNSTTVAKDVNDKETAHMVLLSLCESIGSRLRNSNKLCNVVSVSVRGSDFITYSHQQKLFMATDSTKKIAEVSYKLFDETWKGNSIRHLGIHVADLCNNDICQYSLFEKENIEKQKKIDTTIDNIRKKYGSNAIMRSCFVNSDIYHMSGGIGESDYILMSSQL